MIQFQLTHSPGISKDTVYGYSNGTQILEQLLLVNTYEEFSSAVKNNWRYMSLKATHGGDDFSPLTTLDGGLWMGDDTSKPTILVNIRQLSKVSQMMNFYNVMASGVGISSSYYEFATTTIPNLTDFKAEMFLVYYGLIMAW